jgi:hypothetical protein
MPDLYDNDNIRTLPRKLPPPLLPPPDTPAERACWIMGVLSILCAPASLVADSFLLSFAGLVLGVIAAGLPGRKRLAITGLILNGTILFLALVGTVYLHSRRF